MADTSASVAKFVATQQLLIDLERKAEVERTDNLRQTLTTAELVQRGLCLVKLTVASSYTGFGGKCHVDLELVGGGKNAADNLLPANKFRPGDIVTIEQNIKGSSGVNMSATSSMKQASAPAGSSDDGQQQQQRVSGVVYKTSDARVTVSLSEPLPDYLLDCVLRLDMGANDTTYKRCCNVISKLGLGAYSSLPCSHLVDVLFGQSKPLFTTEIAPSAISWLNPGLNDVQRSAVSFCLAASDVALIHGPPGTGKTTTIVELINQIVMRHGPEVKILACGPSNVSVDNIVERLVASNKTSVVRLGHPARMLPSVLAHSLESVMAASDAGKLVADIKREMDAATKKLARPIPRQERKELYNELKNLRKELKKRERDSVQQVLQSTQVTCCTLTGAMSKMIASSPINYDWVIIDEAPQSMEVHCWMAILKGKRLVLAGDHKQLPPTILSDAAEKKGLSLTLFDRLIKAYGDQVTRMLTVQYRMNAKIMQWSSNEMYGGKLTSAPSVQAHLLCELPRVKKTEETESALFFIDTTGCSLYETEAADDESKSNEGEADVVVQHVKRLLDAGVTERDMAVITPYNAQVGRLRSKLSVQYPQLEIGSVDGFQGREKEAVVISLVRSNDKREVGFLAEHRRLNVAITRARRHVCVIGDSDTVSNDKFLGRLVDWLCEHGELRSAEEYAS
ncbi:immunoglobulin mu binding protein 2 [Capsaspora owczarzaki ATCC 30864]|uniref:immunoglobulin mu binding protein 2 n=1 Tax=Capsaspora owczarzaki (strain ATCC 30864) TaxID=595528 RepID=UPI0001FE6406|nr:immunoglobulin mu binding protein 2 [Capsaspora owczarzaki ATCC 30864]|eukprot:XP_004345662.1 immunoglobulin mu binding protein 2 [Capsaspora owczarzaki ATCC 30864]